MAVGTAAHMPLHPWGAMFLGAVAAVISTIGYKYMTVSLYSILLFCYIQLFGINYLLLELSCGEGFLNNDSD